MRFRGSKLASQRSLVACQFRCRFCLSGGPGNWIGMQVHGLDLEAVLIKGGCGPAKLASSPGPVLLGPSLCPPLGILATARGSQSGLPHRPVALSVDISESPVTMLFLVPCGRRRGHPVRTPARPGTADRGSDTGADPSGSAVPDCPPHHLGGVGKPGRNESVIV